MDNDLYILHFKGRYWNNARHYCGYTTIGYAERIKKHRNGTGSQLVRYALDKGIDFVVGLVEHFDTKQQARNREIQLKNEKNLARHCKVCQELKRKGVINDNPASVYQVRETLEARQLPLHLS